MKRTHASNKDGSAAQCGAKGGGKLIIWLSTHLERVTCRECLRELARLASVGHALAGPPRYIHEALSYLKNHHGARARCKSWLPNVTLRFSPGSQGHEPRFELEYVLADGARARTLFLPSAWDLTDDQWEIVPS